MLPPPYDEPTLPASPAASTSSLQPEQRATSPSPAPVFTLAQAPATPGRPMTRRQLAQQAEASSSSISCGQTTGPIAAGSSAKGKGGGGGGGGGGLGSGRRRGKENIPPPSEGSFSSGNGNAYQAGDVAMSNGPESSDDEADELNIPPAATAATARPATLKRGRTPSTADLGANGVNRRRIVRSESSSSSSFALARSSPPTSYAGKSTSSIAGDDCVVMTSPVTASGLPTPIKPTTRSAAAASSSSSYSTYPSPTKTPEPPKRASAVRTRTMPEFTHANGQLATPPKTPAKGQATRAASAGPADMTPTKAVVAVRRELKPSLYARARALLRCSSSTLTTSTAAAAAAASKLDVTVDDPDTSGSDGGGALIGRSVEYSQILDFLTPALAPPRAKAREVAKTLYVSGPPGTGKTALLSRLADQERAKGTTVGVVNCFTAAAGPGGRAMWERVGEELFGEGGADGWVKGGGRETVIERLKQAKGGKFILILDELDSLVAVPVASSAGGASSTASPSMLSPSLLLLQTLFLLPTATTNLALLAISNTLDFASRYLATLPCPPQTLAFAAYDAGQMSAIILDRLVALTEPVADGKAEQVLVVEEKAVELAARKVMAENGDLRLCLDVVRLAVELVEAEWKKASLTAPTGAIVPIKKAGMTHVLKALQKAKSVACTSRGPASGAPSSAGGLAASAIRTVDGVPRTPSKKTVNAGTVQKIQSLNIQSRLVLVALLIHSRRASLGLAPLAAGPAGSTAASASAAVKAGGERTTSGALLSTYIHLLSSSDSPINALSPSDFHTVLDLLADAALVALDQTSPAKRRTPANAVVQLSCLEEEVVKGLVGSGHGGGAEEEEARRILEREEGRMDRLRTRLGKERKMEKACTLEDRL